MAVCAEEVTARIRMNEGVSDFVRRLMNPVDVVELVLRNCVVKEPAELITLIALIGRCVRLRRLYCASCALPPSELLQRAPDCEILNVNRIASRLSRSSLRRLYVEVGGDHNFKLLRELLRFYASLTELHVHVVRGGTFANAVSECLSLHDSLVQLESFTFTSELPLPFPYEPDFTSAFSVIVAVCANLRHKMSDASWSCLELRQIANQDQVWNLTQQLVVVAVMNDETEELFRAASRRHLWTHHVVELNLSTFHVGPDLDLMELLQEGTLNRLQAFSAPPCAFRSQSDVRRLEASCPNLLDLDVRVQRSQGHFRCASCELLIRDEGTVQPPSNPGTPYFRHNGIARLTLCDVSSDALLWFLECYGGALTLRLVNWSYFESPHYGRLCEHLGGNAAIRCLVIQHHHLPIGDEGLQASLSRMTSLRHLCLLTLMPVSNIDALSILHQIIARAGQLTCVHIHYIADGSEQRMTWLRRGDDGVVSRGAPCFACCSTATFIGMVKPVQPRLRG
ncbi:hypothetical protein MTO96_024329 [Rhipicephalus appendiculatus]